MVDDEDRENEGDLVMAAEAVTPEKIAFFLAHTSGVICVPLLPERADELELPLMVSENTESQRTAFTVSVDYGHGTTTGISAEDRAVDHPRPHRSAHPPDRAQPARPHLPAPLPARWGAEACRAHRGHHRPGRRRRACTRPGCCASSSRTTRRAWPGSPSSRQFAETHGLRLITIADLIRYRRHKDKLVKCIAGPARIPTEFGDFAGYVYESEIDGEHHLAVVRGDVRGKSDVLVRVHSECLTGDVFGSLRCDCGPQLHEAIRLIAEEGTGVVVYLRGHEGRGIGLAHKLRAYNLQEQGHDTVDANLELGLPVDNREYGIGAQILVDLGVTTMRLMTNNPMKYGGLEGFGLDIVERVPLTLHANPENIAYLRTKRERLGPLHGRPRRR